MKKYFSGLLTGIILCLSLTAFAAVELNVIPNPYKVLIDSVQSDVEGYNINGFTFLKLADFKKAGITVKFNETDRQIEVTSSQVTSSNNQVNSSNSMNLGKVTIKINKVIQDSDSLRLYITYINESNKSILSGDCLTKIVSNGKQYEYNSDFNFNRYYGKNIIAPNTIESGVTADSVIFFPPINNVDKINIVLSSDFESYRFNNVEVTYPQVAITPITSPQVTIPSVKSPTINNNKENSQSTVTKISLDETNNYTDWISTSDLIKKYNVYYFDSLDMSNMSKACDASIENKNSQSKITFIMPGYNYKENALYSVTVGQNTFLMWTKYTYDYYFRESELKTLGIIK